MADSGGKNPKDDNREATRSHAEDGGNVSEWTDRSTKKETEEKQNKNGKLSPCASTSASKQSGSNAFVNAQRAKYEHQPEHLRSPRAETHLENQTSNKARIATKTGNLSGQSVCRTKENSQKFCVDKSYSGVEVEYKTISSETDQREGCKTEGTTGNSSVESGLKGEQMPATTAGGSNYGATSSGHDDLCMTDLDDSMVYVGYPKEISIYVKWPCGKTVKLQNDPLDSINSVKIKLGNPEGICLMFQDKELVEEKPLLYYEIKDGDTLYALNRQESDKSSTADDLKNTQNQLITTGETTGGNNWKGMENPAITAGDSTGENGSKVTQYPAMTAGESSGGNDMKGLQNQPMCTGDTTGGNGLKGMENLAMTEADSTGGSGSKGMENPAMTEADSTGGSGLKGMENYPASTGDSAEGSDLTQRQEPGMAASNVDEGHESTEIHNQTMTACDSPADLQVIVVAFDQKKIAIDVKPDETVAAVKKKLMDKKHPDCDIDGFSLNLCGEKLDDMQTVESCNIQPNGEIIMTKKRSKAGKKEKMHPLSSTDEHGTGATDEYGTGATDEHGTGATDEHGTGATDEHGTGADQAVESDEDVQPHYNNNLEESTGNPLEFTEGLVSIKGCNEGSSLKLTCSVNKQNMNAIWYKDEKPLEQNERITQISKDLTHILKIQNLCLSDAGEYRVKIVNLELTSKVTVKDVPLAFQQELVMEDSLEEGLNLQLRCSMNKLHTIPTWYKDGKPLEKNKRIKQISEGLSHILEIQNVYLQDSGVYAVKIENLSSTSKVTILEKPLAVTLSLQKTKKVEEGKDVQMKCIVSKPNLKAKWTLNGKVIKNMGTRILVESSEMRHQLTIKNVTMDDAGEYCLEIEDLQEKTFLEVCDDKENEDIGGARGNSSPIFNSSSRPDETGEYVRLKDTSHVNEDATHDYVNIAGQDDTVGLNEQMAKQNSFTTSKSKHSDTLKETHMSSKTVPSGNEDERFNDDSHSLTLNPSTGICQLKKIGSASVPASKDVPIPEKGHDLHKASVQTVQQSSKMVKEKPMVNLCGKDLGDTSQSDGESNPHSSTEDPDLDDLITSFNTGLKLNESDACTAGSLTATGGQQSAGQHGASGKEDSKIFPVIYKYNGNKQERRKLTNLNDYIKYRYVTKNKAHFKKVADDLQNEKQIAISLNIGVLHIDQGQGRMDSFKTVFKFILRSTENIIVNGFPIFAVDYEDVKKELLNPESNLPKEIEIFVFENMIYVACENSLSADVDNYVTKTLKKFSYANKGNISEKCEVPYILRKILEKDHWKKQFKYIYPNVSVDWEPDDDEDVVKVVFSGNKEEKLKAMKWFEENIVGEYCCGSKEMVKIPELSLFSQPEEIVHEYLRMKYENQTDIMYVINRKMATVWLCSLSSQAKADVAMNELTNKGEIVKTVKIPVDKTLLKDTGINELIPDWNKSKFAVVQADEDKIVVKGLEKYVCEFEGKIKEMLERKQNMPKAGNFLEYDSYLLYIEANGVLKRLSETFKIQYSTFKNAKRNGIYFKGEGTCLTKFNEELEKKRKEYITHNIDIHLGKGMESAKLNEILHIADKDHDGYVRIEKVKYKDTTPGNHQTATVLGPTLKDDLQDCLYSQWCLDTYTVTVVETRSDFQSADVVLVPVDDRSKSDFTPGSVKEITVPILESKMYTKNPIDIIEKTISNTLSDEACVSVHIKSSAINGWSRYRYVKPILYSLKQWAEKSKGPRKDIVFCCCDKDAFYCCSEYCQDAFKIKCETVKPINKDLYMNDFVVEVRKGGIVDFEVDVIVNTTSDDLKLDSGAVSSTILNSAGPELQNDVKQKKPDGIAYGEILETKAFKLKKAKVILHGALEAYDKTRKSLQKLEEFVSSCFSHADSKQYTSIALPAIGTGNLGYNKNEVAATMFKAAKKFFRDHHPSALRRVLFVIYEKDWDCLKAFEKEDKFWNQYLIWQSRTVVYEGVRVQPNQGSIIVTTTDAVIYFWDDGIIHGSVTTRSNTVLAACGRNVFDTVSKKMRLKEANMMTLKAENIKVDMFLTRCQNSSDEISKATRECLLKADKCKDITSICIAFDKSHTFLSNKELTYNLCEAIKDVSHELHQINQVEIMVENEKSFQEVLEYFDMEKAGLLKMKEPLRIEVSGFKEHVTKAVAEIKEKFSQLQTGNDITEAEHENDKKDTEIKGTTLDKEYIEPSPIFAKYVEVHHIPKKLDIEGLRKDLFREGEFPVLLPKLVYYVGSSKALLICQSEQDAKKLSECTKLEPYKFFPVKGKAVSLLTKTIDQNTVEKMKEDSKYDEFKQELVRADIQIAGELPFKFVAPSTYQYSYAMFLLKKLTGTLPGSVKDDDFHKIETIKDVQENVWDILSCSDQFREIKDKCNDIAYDKDTYTVMIGPKVSKDDFKKITVIVDNLREKEWEDIPLEAKHCNKSTVDRWCDEVKEVTGYECCKYIAGKGKVLVYAVNYDDRMKIKHLFSVKTGKIKTTGKGRRVGRATSDKDDRKPDTTGPSLAKSKSPDRKIDGKKKYITKENIYVYVYEANILNLDVDCIVNAANESLQHGGGVAAVIEKAAGYKLKEESRDFVRKYGNLPVGKACTTTAGNLSYDCVIHTVGPRWSAYSPHSMQDVQECQLHLYLAVYNSFLEAEKRGLKSIALPAISSAIFGVPEEICVQQYAKATFDYSRKTSDEPTALKEIHFIDKNSNIVKKIQDAFYLVFVKGEMPDCDTSKFVKSRRHGKGHSPGSYTGAQASFSSSVHKDSFNAQTQFATSDVFEVTQTEPLSFFDDESSAYAYLLHGKEEYKLLLSRGDLLKVKASAVVIPVDDRGNRGNIANSLFSRIPDIYRKDYTYKLSSECHHKKDCDVFITHGYECDYPFIVHAIYPANAKNKAISQRKHDVQKLYKNVFSLCDTKTGIREVVAPLLGPDIRSDSDIRACAEMFLQSYLDYYSRPVTKKSLLVHLVCREDPVYDCVKRVFDEYVMSKKAELNKTQENMDTSASIQTVEKPDNVHEEENCVICMDTITDPETLLCGHTFCKDCIQQQFQFKEACPTCGQVCGVITGDQPPGEMRSAVDRYTDCSGYNGHGRIAITYNFPSGRQGPEHPSPGTFYKGITRVAYLPNNDEGRKILAMLEVAFKRKLVFTIGNSRTTGQEGVITWNDIHHKTNPRPHQQFGYPDPGYLERVKDELAVKGVTEKDIQKQ